MSQDKKKAVPQWAPHPMPGAHGPAGPSAEARAQLIEEGIWKSDAPNREIAKPRPPSPPQPAASDERRQTDEPAYVSPWPPRGGSVGSRSQPATAMLYSSVEPEEADTPADDDPADWRHEDSVGAAPTPSERIEQFEDSVAPTPSDQHRRHADASRGVAPTPFTHSTKSGDSAAPTPTSSGRRADTSVVPTPAPRRHQPEPSIAPTPASPRRQLKPSAAPTPASPRRQPEPSLAPTPASHRRQRHSDADSDAMLGTPDRRQVEPASSAGSTSSRPRGRRNSAAPGRVQTPRSHAKHEADARVRRTLRVTVKVDQHLHGLAALLGLDLNGALSVAVVEHHLYLLNRRGPKDD